MHENFWTDISSLGPLRFLRFFRVLKLLNLLNVFARWCFRLRSRHQRGIIQWQSVHLVRLTQEIMYVFIFQNKLYKTIYVSNPQIAVACVGSAVGGEGCWNRARRPKIGDELHDMPWPWDKHTVQSPFPKWIWFASFCLIKSQYPNLCNQKTKLL